MNPEENIRLKRSKTLKKEEKRRSKVARIVSTPIKISYDDLESIHVVYSLSRD